MNLFGESFFDQALDFLTNFAYRCHHRKEEERLFPLLRRKRSASNGVPIDVMLQLHNRARVHLAAVRANLEAAEQGRPEALALIRREALGSVRLLRHHIQRADSVLLPMAGRLLGPAEMLKLNQSFEVLERQLGSEFRARYEALATKLLAWSELR